MKSLLMVVLATVPLAACGPDKTAAAAASPPAAVVAARPAAALVPATIEACVLSVGEVSAALGEPFGAAPPIAPIPGAPQRSCAYDPVGGGPIQLRINVTWLEPSSAATSRRMMMAMLAGTTTPLPGDPDGAVFQDQADLGTFALHYSRGDYLYEVRLFGVRDAARAKGGLLKLRRP